MASTPTVSRPLTSEIVTTKILSSRYQGSATSARAFAGQSDPSNIWRSMITDTQEAYAYYRELEEKDEDVACLLSMLKLAVLCRERKFVAADDSAEALALKDEMQEMFEDITNWHNVLDAVLDAAGYGVSISELMFEVSESQVRLVNVLDRPQELFMFNERSLPQIGPLRFLENAYAFDGVLVPEEKFLIFTYRPRNRNRRGRPLLRSVFWPSWFKRQTLKFWLKFGEKGPGTVVVKYPSGSEDDAKNEALESAEEIADNIAVAVPDNFELVTELLTTARSQSPDVYEKLVRRNAMAIARVIVGQTLTSYGAEDGKGSLALGEVHKEMFDMKWQELAVGAESAINDQLVRRLILWNHGPDALKIAPKWTIDKSIKDDLSVRSQVDLRLQQMGMEIPTAYAREKYSIPEVGTGDVALEPRAVPVSGSVEGDGHIPGMDPDNEPDDEESYSEAERLKAQADIRRLMAQLRKQSFASFAARIKTLVDESAPGR